MFSINMEIIAILLSTYNGIDHLESQLDSILQQTAKNWKLYIRDDGSTDGTIDIITKYTSKNDHIIFLKDNFNLGAALSFMKLLREVDAEYYMFCDQDDIRLPDKVKNSYEYFKKQEISFSQLPILVFSDAKVVNSKLQILSDSFIKSSGIKTDLLSYIDYAKTTNLSPGCTYIFNNQLKKRAVDFPGNIPMHDWWLVLNANEYGKLFFLAESNMLYRQHAQNVIGAVEVNRMYYIRKFLFIFKTVKLQFSQYLFLKEINMINNIFEYYYLKIKFKFKK